MMKLMHADRILTVLAAVLLAVPCFAGGVDLIRKGQDSERAGNRNAAIEAYTQAIGAGDLNASQLSFAYYRRGSIHGFLGNNLSGIEDFSRSVELNTRFGAAYSLRGYLLGVVGKYDAAERDHLAAIDLAKYETWADYTPWVLQHYADLFRRRKEFSKALEYCDKALQAKPYSSVFFRRAWIYLDMGNKTQAKAEFAKFEEEMRRQGTSWDVFWPDERGAISRLRELR